MKEIFKQQFDKCNAFFDELTKLLDGQYEVVHSNCKKSKDRYLIPNGTAAEITFNSKPASSFRVSDHWNWVSDRKYCDRLNYQQCYNEDLPRGFRRDPNSTKATKPIFAAQVAFMCPDGVYRAVYGEIFDRKTKTWSWLEADPADVVCMIP